MFTNISLQELSDSLNIGIKPTNQTQEDIKIVQEVSSFEYRMLTIQLNFSDVYEISPLTVQDQLQLNFTNSTYLQSLDGISLHKDFHNLTHQLRPQNPNSYFVKDIEFSVKFAKITIDMNLIWLFLINLILSRGMIYMFCFIRCQQLILNLPIYHIIIPGNVSLVF